MNNLTENSLSVIWWIEQKNSEGKVVGRHEEVDGVIAYGYWQSKPDMEPSFPQKFWPEGTLMKSYPILADDEKDEEFILMWEIRIFEWPKPTEWETTLKQTLMRMIDAGAKVAWFGVEGNLGSPLFDPQHMPPSGVYACLTKELGFKCTAKLGMPYHGFSSEDFFQLKTLLFKSTAKRDF